MCLDDAPSLVLYQNYFALGVWVKLVCFRAGCLKTFPENLPVSNRLIQKTPLVKEMLNTTARSNPVGDPNNRERLEQVDRTTECRILRKRKTSIFGQTPTAQTA